MKKLINILLCVLILLAIYVYQEQIISGIYYVINNIRQPEYKETMSLYSKKRNFEYVSIADDLTPHSFQDILNIIYTSLDNRYSSVTFYCPMEYKECIDDVSELTSSNNSEELTIIGNMVSPYNNFSNISIYYDTSGKINIDFSYLYDDDMILELNEFFDQIIASTINDSMTTQEKLKALHDYLITYSEYDTKYEEELALYGKGNYESNTAYGLFKNKLSICSGYADAYALLLDKLNIDNFKVASDTHVWNVVYIDGKYYHIDVTWDDPTNNFYGTLLDKFFMIDTNTLLSYDNESHNFNRSIYRELK
jgi:hypothetical protein